MAGSSNPTALYLDRATHVRKDLDALEAALREAGTKIVPVWRDQNLIRGAELALLELEHARALLDLPGELVFLGTLGADACFAIDVSSVAEPARHGVLASAGELKDLRFAGPSLPHDHVAIGAYARGILYWHKRHQHCGACGAQTVPREGGHTRVCRAESCATTHFPRTDPAVIVLVYDGERCLLGRQKTWPKGMYSTLAGFVEPGETIEQAVAREIEEESGVEVEDVRYFRSQPWPYPSSLMIGFTARARTLAIRLDDELEDARWFTREEVRASREHGFFVPSSSFSLSGQLIEAFLNPEAHLGRFE